MTAILTLDTDPMVPPADWLSHVGAVPRRPAPEVYRARRRVVLAAVFGLVVAAAVGIASLGNPAAAGRGGQVADSVVITVMPGDTLWGIARGLAPDSDPRSLVYELSALVGRGPLQPGQELVVPRSVLD